jgi:hypothetical protein
MTMSLPVRDVLRSGQTYNRGRFRLAVMGRLVVRGDDSRVVDDPAAVAMIGSFARASPAADARPEDRSAGGDDASIRIVDPTFLPRLRAEIPRLTSGDFAYFDVAMICGSTRLDGEEMVLERIWSATLYRGGKELWALENPGGD